MAQAAWERCTWPSIACSNARAAIKLIHPDRAGDPRILARFEREVCMTAQLSHWNTVEIFDYGRTDDGTFFYVMEYLPGLNLQDLLDRHGPLPAQRVVYLLRQVCQGLREAHQVGLIHRDIKPANVFAAKRGALRRRQAARLWPGQAGRRKSVGKPLPGRRNFGHAPLHVSRTGDVARAIWTAVATFTRLADSPMRF